MTLPGVVRHTFTHFQLELTMLAGSIPGEEDVVGSWCPPAEFERLALPTLMKKVARLALSDGDQPPLALQWEAGTCCARRLFVVGDEVLHVRACGLGGK